ncbi:hypothetical protein GHT06_018618 [Daphnia sinensis]|uniref:Uncharacterized protein n=1 Tax=Daphnia sinensis TaxID=1820382 RepID=A0AAD5PQC8_9CRUS|nr:hypothetical protein GHT06_018618 [Daphnia sinensis]
MLLQQSPHRNHLSTAEGSSFLVVFSTILMGRSIDKMNNYDLDLQIVHHNQPALVTVYKDPETQQEKVFILKSLPGGSTEVEFSFVGNGPGSSTAHIKHSWPPVMFDIDSLFAEVSIRNEKISQFHPKIVALKNELENNLDSVDAIPQAVIEVPLPIPVQTAKASYQFIGIKTPDGSAIMIADLTAYQNSYSVPKSDMKVTFVEI